MLVILFRRGHSSRRSNPIRSTLELLYDHLAGDARLLPHTGRFRIPDDRRTAVCKFVLFQRKIIVFKVRSYFFAYSLFFALQIWDIDPDAAFRPSVEDSQVEGAFLTDVPHKLKYQRTDVPWLIGLTTGEGAFKAASWCLAICGMCFGGKR